MIFVYLPVNIKVSIHAPARGAIYVDYGRSVLFSFQFTHPRGVRSSTHADGGQSEVSIHAPARGAILMDSIIAMRQMFQFTHPRGVR